MKISFVIPCYNSENTISSVVDEIKSVVNNLQCDYEVLLVNDCSKDNTSKVIKQLSDNDSSVIAIDLAKNSGQAGATMCGLNNATGDYVVCGDDDGQTPFSELEKFKTKLETENFDVVCAKYVNRDQKEFVRNFGSKLNILMARKILGQPKDLYLSVFFIAKRFVIDEIVQYKNPYPYITGLLLRTTHNIGNVEVQQRDRAIGKSGYTFAKLLALWINGFTAFSVKPLRVSILIGTVVSVLGFIFGIATIIRKIIDPSIVLAGYSSLMAVLLFIGGLIMLILGMIGEYVGRIYISMNKSPQYVIKNIYRNS